MLVSRARARARLSYSCSCSSFVIVLVIVFRKCQCLVIVFRTGAVFGLVCQRPKRSRHTLRLVRCSVYGWRLWRGGL